MKIKTIERNKDYINESEDLELLYEFENFPVFMGCTNQPVNEDILVDMKWEISQNSGAIQLNPLLPLEVLYQEAHGSGNIGATWLEHHQKFAKFIQKQAPESVLEIGGLHGILSREYKKNNLVDWTILEPNPSPAEDVDTPFIKGFFDESFTFDGEINAIIHSHVFEHVYYPNEFIAQLSNFLKHGQKLIFSIPKMEEMLKRKYNNCLNFEHTVLLTEPYIDHLLSKYDFKQVDKEYFLDDHSIFYAYVKDTNVDIIELPKGLYEHNKTIYLEYIKYHKQLIKDINSKIDNSNNQKPIYLFGAHIFAQYLIQFGLNTNRIVCLLDNDPEKQGKRLYGTSMKVESPTILKNIEAPIIILKAGVYNNEIKKDITENINPNTEFYE